MELAMRKTQKKTVANDHGREVKSFKSRYRVQPLEHMLKVINNDKLPVELRCFMAEAAAPYLHPKLGAMAIDDVAGPKGHPLDLSKLSNEELDQLEQIVAKGK
jgi:hypothetical protein